MKKISVIGLGYIGLPTAILAAQSGYDVTGFDINLDKIDRIKKGDPTIIEPEIRDRLNLALTSKNLKIENQLNSAHCFVVAVPTPLLKDGNNDFPTADMSAVFDVGIEVARVLKPGNLVILESTVKVGTTMKFAKLLAEKSGLKLGMDFYVAHCPERVLPGSIFKELCLNDRVIGGICEQSAKMAKRFYLKFVQGDFELVDDKTAEMVKLIENSSRDVQIAFANQVFAMCKNMKVDPYKLIDLANHHPRVNILSPSCGVGGHCISVDPWFLIESFRQDTKLLKTARAINDNVPFKIISEVISLSSKLKEKIGRKPTIGILGLTFKPDIDDIRHSPALQITLELKKYKDNFDLIANDPYLSKNFFIENEINNLSGLHELLHHSDVVLALVKHKQFLEIKKEELNEKLVLDRCGLLYEIKKLHYKLVPQWFTGINNDLKQFEV